MVPGPPPRSGSFQYTEGTTLRVTGFGPEVRNLHLQPEFGEFGHVLRIHVLQGKGVAFVEYQDKVDAKDAMATMDGKKVQGYTLAVSLAGPPPDPRKKEEGDRPELRRGESKPVEPLRVPSAPQRSRRRSRSRSRSCSRSRRRRKRSEKRSRSKSRGRGSRSRSRAKRRRSKKRRRSSSSSKSRSRSRRK
eukprot:TRINITY_DN14590_c0_g1_i1.p1 TRINITY_DN14590_c0_g1~~TRINITY_DN14590_c0_g1_i1.p1  ORF type:complete len:198 (+),score=34.12 TRINITY_DN14590_c0_g1_i1:25-594(+)